MTATRAEIANPPIQLLRKVDHFMVPFTDPVFAWLFLTETLRLPLVGHDGGSIDPWTEEGRRAIDVVRNRAWGGGLVGLGNVHLEPYPVSADPTSASRRQARITWIAFEPQPIDDAFVAELDRRGVAHTQPNFSGERDGGGGVMWSWTTFGVKDLLSPPTAGVFCCDYHSPRRVVDEELRRLALDACAGGLLGIVEVAEIVIGVRAWDTMCARWQNLLRPIPPTEPGLWRVGSGPAIRLIRVDEDAVQGLVLTVRSLADAESAARGLNLATRREEDELSVTFAELDGFTIRLRQTMS